MKLLAANNLPCLNSRRGYHSSSIPAGNISPPSLAGTFKCVFRVFRQRMPYILLIGVFVLALSLRVLVVDGSQVYLPLRADAGQYYSYAYNLKYHNIYSITDTWRTGATPVADDLRNPGYPIFLSFLVDSKASSASLNKIAFVQSFISTLTVVLIYLTIRFYASFYIAVGGALLTTLSPHLISMNVYIMTESIAAFTVVFFLWLYAWTTSALHAKTSVQQEDRKQLRIFWQLQHLPWFLLGIAHAVGTLVRPTMQWYLIPLLGVVYVLPKQKWGIPWHRVLWLSFGFLVLMLPWWIRNIVLLGELNNSLLLKNALHHGMYPNFIYGNIAESFGYPYRFDPRSSEIAASLISVLTEIIHRFMIDPGKQLYWYLVGKPIMFWNWSNDAAGAGDVFIFPMLRSPFATNNMLHLIHDSMRFLHIPMVILGMIGSVTVWFSKSQQYVQDMELLWFMRIISSLLLYFVALHMIGAPFPRYNIPVLPVLYLQVMLCCSLAMKSKINILHFLQRR